MKLPKKVLLCCFLVLVLPSAAVSADESKTVNVDPVICESEIPRRISESECAKYGGDIMHPKCVGCEGVRVCVMPAPETEYINLDQSKVYQKAFVGSLPVKFHDPANPELEISLTFPAGKLPENELTSQISGKSSLEGPKQEQLLYNWALYGLQLKVKRCEKNERDSYTCCAIYLDLNPSGSATKLTHADKPISEGIYYSGEPAHTKGESRAVN